MTTDVAASQRSLKARIRHLYVSHDADACRFRYRLFVVDVAIILFIIVTSFLPRSPLITALDVICGLVVLADFAARMWISGNRKVEMRHWSFWVDLIAVVSFLGPLAGESFAFVRVLRTLRLLHTYQMLARLRQDSAYFRRNEEVILAGVHLGIFVFIMTALVYETQYRINAKITNYADALYFTVTALTTTGFGDITLDNTLGRMLSVVIMLFGVTLFLRLAQVLFRPQKVRFQCPSCGLGRHEHDAVHCKACGVVLNIPDDND
jgi:voltage-gated potassium channel